MLETQDLILRKAVFHDWQSMYENVWIHRETARFMLWEVTDSPENAKLRIERTIAFQKKNPISYLVCEKTSGQAIGFAGMIEIEPGVFEDCGVALGPKYVGKGYGKQILSALMQTAAGSFGASKLICSCRSENEVSRRLQLSCGFTFSHTENRIDPRNDIPYVLEFYEWIPLSK